MTFDLASILASKRAFRQRLVARPIAEKLALLDELRARSLAVRPSRKSSQEPATLREEPPTYHKERP